MTPEYWARVQAAFAAALERPPEARAAFVQGIAQSDAHLAREVESLLSAHEDVTSQFLESPALGQAVDQTEVQLSPPPGMRKTLPPGTRLGTYEILSAIGAGGMGEVYRARDSNLQREVAVKVLPQELANDSTALARFEREALAVAALSHPNILAIYDFGKQERTAYAVMELLEGQTLRSALKAGPFSIDQILSDAIQIVEGLCAAHEKGIVHRDLKPENLFLTRDGRMKILDFGLAKRIAPIARGEETSAPTVEGHTTPGMVMGTLGYMSPEQLLGADVDHRTDQFSLGVVLYEMVSRQAPFRGNSAVAIADAILHKQPPELVDKTVPPEVKTIIRRLLEKDASKRFPTSADVLVDLKRIEAARSRRRLSRPARVVVAAGLFAAIAVGAWFWRKAARERWALETAAPEIARLIEQRDNFAAATLARRARAILPQDPTLEKLWMRATGDITIITTPPGAEVLYRPYVGQPDKWESAGATPLKDFRAPAVIGLWQVRKAGFATTVIVDGPVMSWTFELQPEGRVPADMVPVAGGETKLGWPYLDLPPLTLTGFLIDRNEVTNAEYKRFIDAGGYEKKEYWKQPFGREGRVLSWDEAMLAFRDATSRPGPATWEAGSFPAGSADQPVTGLSWFEAAAYAEFAHKVLPTVYHWSLAAQTYCAQAIVPGSNFRSDSTRPVGQPGSLSGFGTNDMAGNVKEWCLNETWEGRRFILGGGFGDPLYMYSQTDAHSPWERRPNFGFRCARLNAAPPEGASARLQPSTRDYWKEQPVADGVFKAYKGLFSYDKSPLDGRVEETKEATDWIREKVSFTAAYGAERVPAYLYLPKKAKRPLQAVVYFPGGYAFQTDKLDPNTFEEEPTGFLPRAGRAVVYPIYRGTYERADGLNVGGKPLGKWRDRAILLSKDLGRTLDYLESRPDIDATKLAYFGFSAGGALAPMLLAVEPRFKAAIIESGGFWFRDALPEVDWINFITRVKVPLLMLNGRYDDYFPLGSAQLPYFRRAGTPDKDKKHVLFDEGHSNLPEREVMRESLDWLDRYLGPVKP